MTTSATPLPRHESLAAALRGEILRGRFRPGERLPGERELAERLGAHRSQVREALRCLEQQGLVATRRGGGARVRALGEASLEVVPHLLVVDGRLDRGLLEQVLDVHELLIAGATRLAVERADEDARLHACELLDRLASPATGDDAYLDTATALLDLIVEASGNLVLALARRAVNPLFEARFREVRKRFRPDPAQLAPLAARLRRAIRERDPDVAEAQVRELLRLKRQRSLDALESLHARLEPCAPTRSQEDRP